MSLHSMLQKMSPNTYSNVRHVGATQSWQWIVKQRFSYPGFLASSPIGCKVVRRLLLPVDPSRSQQSYFYPHGSLRCLRARMLGIGTEDLLWIPEARSHWRNSSLVFFPFISLQVQNDKVNKKVDRGMDNQNRFLALPPQKLYKDEKRKQRRWTNMPKSYRDIRL